jgi:hypothetical protein
VSDEQKASQTKRRHELICAGIEGVTSWLAVSVAIVGPRAVQEIALRIRAYSHPTNNGFRKIYGS